ncbi:MAG: D-alanine--D-alanine ligase, partial [Cyclonatronaceae bacterium]
EYLMDLEHFKDLPAVEKNGRSCALQTDAFGNTRLVETGKTGLFKKPAQYDIDVVLVAFHGAEGENGGFQGLCEMHNLPYTGSGLLASSVGMDKRMAKIYAKSAGVAVTDDVLLSEPDWVARKEALMEKIAALGKAVIIKPVHLGSSIGVQRAASPEEIERAVETGFRYDTQLLAETAVSPLMEINCSVLGNAQTGTARASVCEQPLGADESLSFEDKYMGDEGKGMASATRTIPAPISDALTKQIQQTSVELFNSMDAAGVARFDYLMNRDTGAFFFNEINTIPGSFSYYLWEKTELKFPALVQELLEIAKERHQIKNGRIRSYETNLLSQKAVKGIKGLKGKG